MLSIAFQPYLLDREGKISTRIRSKSERTRDAYFISKPFCRLQSNMLHEKLSKTNQASLKGSLMNKDAIAFQILSLMASLSEQATSDTIRPKRPKG